MRTKKVANGLCQRAEKNQRHLFWMKHDVVRTPIFPTTRLQPPIHCNRTEHFRQVPLWEVMDMARVTTEITTIHILLYFKIICGAKVDRPYIIVIQMSRPWRKKDTERTLTSRWSSWALWLHWWRNGNSSGHSPAGTACLATTLTTSALPLLTGGLSRRHQKN